MGPIIATLSVGGNAKMTFRMSPRYYTGLTRSGIYNPLEPILPGYRLEEPRKQLNLLYGRVTDEEFEAKQEEMYRIAKAKKVSEKPPVLLSIAIEHGDIVVMHGAEMQKYYEVRLFNMQFLYISILICSYSIAWTL